MQDHGQYAEAEAAFLKAGKPREAIDMHCHQHAWDAALRVAEAHDAAAAAGVYAKQGDALAAADRLHEAEAAYLHVRAHHPRVSVNCCALCVPV